MTIKKQLNNKLRRTKAAFIIGFPLLLLAAWLQILNFGGVISISMMICGLPVIIFGGINLYFGVTCPNCKKGLGTYIEAQKKCLTQVHFFEVSENIKECPYCHIDLNTSLDEVKGVTLKRPEFKSFRVYNDISEPLWEVDEDSERKNMEHDKK